MTQDSLPQPVRVLCLDGGGAKGMYSLGVLREVESMLDGKLLAESFDLIVGVSTGAIIAASLGTGLAVGTIIDEYKKGIPKIMGAWTARGRAVELDAHLRNVFGGQRFDSFKTNVVIVAANYDTQLPLLFKSDVNLAHGRRSSFLPGFGLTIADAIAASCSAHPFFPVKTLSPPSGVGISAIDGGYIANDPSLLAYIDVVRAWRLDPKQIRMLSVGVGGYPESFPLRATWSKLLLAPSARLIQRQFAMSSNTVNAVFDLLGRDARRVRVSETYSRPEHGTSLFETDPAKLDMMLGLGGQSFGAMEAEIRGLFESTSAGP